MLPISLRLVYALNAATFEISSLALLSIVNTRVSIPAEYLPAYGAISFLPYSLRPLFAAISSVLLNCKRTTDENKNRHDKLLFPAFILASLSFVGTTLIPSDGIVLCFFWGFVRGVAGAWSDFLIGMAIIEYSRLQSGVSSMSPSADKGRATYEQTVSVTTAQSSTAKNVGSFAASISTFLFFAKNQDLEDAVVNKLLLGAASIFASAALVSLKYQFHVGDLLANTNLHVMISAADNDDTVNGNQRNLDDDVSMDTSHCSGSTPPAGGQKELESLALDQGETIRSSEVQSTSGDSTGPALIHQQKILEVSTLVAFQTLLAISALQKPIVAVSNQKIWVSLVVIVAIILLFTICYAYQYEHQLKKASLLPPSDEESVKNRSRVQKLPHRQLNLYLLLRYSLPIAGFVMYSYLYSVFGSEPMFLQSLSVLKSAIGSLATFCYEKFLSHYCHSGWPLIGLIATLDIVMGLAALLDVWVIRQVKKKEVDGEYFIDNSLRCLVVAVGLIKYFFAELDYMPTLVLSTTNVYSDDDKRFGDGDESKPRGGDHLFDDEPEERTSLSDDFQRLRNPRFSSLNIDSRHEEEDETETPQLPMISAGMQYASFLSCIDFGAQIGDWITVPIIASLDITRENNWDHLDRLVIICSILRMGRVVFLWLICPPMNSIRTPSPTNNVC